MKNQEPEEIELSTTPNDKYKKFFARFIEIETLPVEQWKVVHLLAYFCQQYRQAYQTEYAWKFNHQSPSKCFEVWQINSLSSKLSSNPIILKEYIDWAFETLIPKAKRKLTSISFMTKDEVVNPYKMLLLSGKNPRQANIRRTTLLPETFVAIISQCGFNAATYGDLAFLSQMYQDNSLLRMFDQLESSGCNLQLLNEIV